MVVCVGMFFNHIIFQMNFLQYSTVSYTKLLTTCMQTNAKLDLFSIQLHRVCVCTVKTIVLMSVAADIWERESKDVEAMRRGFGIYGATGGVSMCMCTYNFRYHFIIFVVATLLASSISFRSLLCSPLMLYSI